MLKTVPGASRISRMNRRQRKKLHVAEFKEVGLFIALHFKQPLDETAWDDWIVRWIETAAEFGLEVGGFGGKLPLAMTQGWLFLHPHGSVTPELAQQVQAKLIQDPAIQTLQAVLADGWYEQPTLG
ncbi:50S ribosome-binding protein YggL [Parvibium lacunae]|uniref:DUF469 family protein n=1 Tax=Parvibium lacunae TaxID=1888893 RepID=A0A368L3J3_9BURK|nr:50S ribosome-binding protein YggL [Parvibium lacunae]RCS58053.1 DUF469 family protein [Parvibium lacunae]